MAKDRGLLYRDGMDSRAVRVSDAEREQTVLVLREHLLAGRLTLEEFSARVEAALGARVGADLARAQEDLPRIAAQAPAGPAGRKPARVTTGLFGHVARRGRLRLRGWTTAVTAFADVDFDLREATIDRPQTTMTVLALCGNIDVYVPEGVNVDVSGLALLGHRRDWGKDVSSSDAPPSPSGCSACWAPSTSGVSLPPCGTPPGLTSSATWKAAHPARSPNGGASPEGRPSLRGRASMCTMRHCAHQGVCAETLRTLAL